MAAPCMRASHTPASPAAFEKPDPNQESTMNPPSLHLSASGCLHGFPARLAALFAALAFPLTAVFAQTVANPELPAASETQSEKIIELSRFEVTTTQDRGYVATNAASAFKTRERLLDIPQVDVVVTQDLIKDIGFKNTSDIVQYFGATSGFAYSENLKMRGFNVTYAYVDEMPNNSIYEDNSWVDSYEIIKGPAQILYLNSSLSGVVLKSSKKPLPFKQHIQTASVDSHGQYRATFDSTAPLGALGGAKLGYRLIGVYQDGDSYWENQRNKRFVLYGTFQADFEKTTFRFAYTYQQMLLSQFFQIVTPDGDTWTGAGRDFANVPPNTLEHFNHHRYFAEIRTQISDNWEHRLKAGLWRLTRYNDGSLIQPSSYDWAAKTETFAARQDYLRYSYWSLVDDVQGNYDLGSTKQVDIFGAALGEYTIQQQLWAATNVPRWRNPTVSLFDRAAINAIVVPTRLEYLQNLPANLGIRPQTIVSQLYWQHSTDFNKYIRAVAGVSWSGIVANSTTNVSLRPFTITSKTAFKFLHRVGLVIRPTEELSVYAMQGTSMNPAVQGALLIDGTLPKPNEGTAQEIGVKAALFGGRLSANLSMFKYTTTNVLKRAPAPLPSGQVYQIPVGDTTQEGYDGDVAWAVTPQWQLIASGFIGKVLDVDRVHVPASYDNSWSFYTRYDFKRDTPLRGLSLGTGVVRVGSRWISTAGARNAVFDDYATRTGSLKLKSGTLWNGFVNYTVNRHWSARLNCVNILDEIYSQGQNSIVVSDPSTPRTFNLEIEHKF